ncbi:MAG: cation:proton antiporter [Pseudomonadota bacterium]
MHFDPVLLQSVIVFLAVAGFAIPLLKRAGISSVLSFIVIGLLIGPSGLGQFTDEVPALSYIVITNAEGVRTFAELGVVFLLFMIGLELSIERLAAMRQLVFGLGGLQVLISAIAIGLIAAAFGNSTQAAIVIGACLALSSTAIVMQLLMDTQRLSSPVGRTSFSILLFQDLAVVPILFLTGFFGQGETTGFALFAGLSVALAKAIAVIGAIILVGRLAVRPLFDLVGMARSRELFMASVLLAIIGTAIVTEKAGLSLALGAFLAGLLLAETQYRHQVEVDIEPFKGLLLGLFFLSVGLSLDISALMANPSWIALSVVGLIALKAAIIFVLARCFGMSVAVAAESALLLAQGGEFAFIVLAVAATQQVVPNETVQFMLIVTILTMLLTPFLAKLARLVGERLATATSNASSLELQPDDTADDLEGHVIIAGYGRVGELLGEVLDHQKIVHLAVDTDAATVARHRAKALPVYFGNATHAGLLSRLSVANAAALVVTMDDRAATESIVLAVSSQYPNLPILARARDREHAKRLRGLGAAAVVTETVEASLDLAEVVLGKVGFTEELSHQIVGDRRSLERQLLA